MANGGARSANTRAAAAAAAAGGHVVYLPTDVDRGPALLAELLADRWLDDQTRALAVDFNVYNPSTSLVTAARFLTEVLPTGLFVVSYRIFTFRVVLYETPSDIGRAVGEVLVFAGTVYFAGSEVRDAAGAPRAHSHSPPPPRPAPHPSRDRSASSRA